MAKLVFVALLVACIGLQGVSADPCTAATNPEISAQSPIPSGLGGDTLQIFGTFQGTKANCFWWYNNAAYVLYQPATFVSASTIECPVPSTSGTDVPDCATVSVTVQVYNDDDTFADRQTNECFSHWGQAPSQWATNSDVTFQEFQYDCGNGGTGCTVPVLDHAAPAAGVHAGDTVTVHAAGGTAFGDEARCHWWSTNAAGTAGSEAGYALYQTPTAITSSSIDCTVPSRVISSGTNAGDTLPLGATVWVVIQTWNTGEPNPQSVDCFSHEGQSYGSWSAGDSVTVQYSNTVANACNPVPTISGVLPTVGVNPGDTVTISGSFHANARCLWWWNQNAYVLYQTAVSHSATEVECTVPSRSITFGPDSGVTIPPCDTARVTIQSWNAGDNAQANTCFTHEGQGWLSWASQDYAEVEYACDNDAGGGCLDGPFDMTWENGNILVANEGAGGGGGSTIAEVAGPTAANAGDVVDPSFLSGFNGPSGITHQNNGNLIITDDQGTGSIWDSTAATAFPSAGQPGGNPNAVRVNFNGTAFIANAAFGSISSFDAAGNFLCELASGVNTPQAVEIDDTLGVVYFTDWQGDLYWVDQTCDATSPVDCTTPANCNHVAVGSSVYPTTSDVTQGGLVKAGGVFYISAYFQDAVLAYDSSTSTASECITGVQEARGLLLEGSPSGAPDLYITSYAEGEIYVRNTATCGAASLYTNCQQASANGMCIPEAANLFYYKGVVMTTNCVAADGCNAGNPDLVLGNTNYYKVGSAKEGHMTKCEPASV